MFNPSCPLVSAFGSLFRRALLFPVRKTLRRTLKRPGPAPILGHGIRTPSILFALQFVQIFAGSFCHLCCLSHVNESLDLFKPKQRTFPLD